MPMFVVPLQCGNLWMPDMQLAVPPMSSRPEEVQAAVLSHHAFASSSVLLLIFLAASLQTRLLPTCAEFVLLYIWASCSVNVNVTAMLHHLLAVAC